MEDAYQETIFLLKKYGIVANKSLGQNFLVDTQIVNQIVESAHVTQDDLVLEIGPGLGTLTNALLQKAKKVIAIELDKKMVGILKERFCSSPNLTILQEDILKVNLEQFIQQEKEAKEVKIVANLPYYITTPIIMKLLEEKLAIETITVMVQKEVADRLIAKPGDKLAGAITYRINYYAEATEIQKVPKESFIPMPEVQSSVIQLKLRKEPKVTVKSEEKLFQLIKISFMQRRKTFLNGVSNSGFVEKEKLRSILQEMQLKEDVRGEDLTLEQFAQITNQLILENN